MSEAEQRAYKRGVRAGIEFALSAISTSHDHLRSLLAFVEQDVAADAVPPQAPASAEYQRVKPSES